jgi:hypothetical protein
MSAGVTCTACGSDDVRRNVRWHPDTQDGGLICNACGVHFPHETAPPAGEALPPPQPEPKVEFASAYEAAARRSPRGEHKR